MTQIKFSAAFRGSGTRYMHICTKNKRDRNDCIQESKVRSFKVR